MPDSDGLSEIALEDCRAELERCLKDEAMALRAVERLRRALHNIMAELGVPDEGYLQPVSNAYEIARKALEE